LSDAFEVSFDQEVLFSSLIRAKKYEGIFDPNAFSDCIVCYFLLEKRCLLKVQEQFSFLESISSFDST